MEVVKNSNLFNTVYPKALTRFDFLDVFRIVLAYARISDECYMAPIRDARLYDVRRDMEFANLIPGV